jgi:Cell division protein FtsI/penicillin-binding protein 2
VSIRTNILLRVYLAFGLILLFAVAVVIQMWRLQFVQGEKWRAMAAKLSTRYETVEATRGNIISDDGALLATSVPEYELHMDMFAGGIFEDKSFYSKVDSLAAKLAELYPDKTEKYYSRLLRSARKDSSRYQLIRRRVTFQELKKLRKFPIFRMGKYKGGLIVIQQNKRIRPFRSLAARTIGYKNENVKNGVGLEGAYASYIDGENGKRLMQRIAGGVYVPVNDDEDEITAKDGADIISTINVNLQDVAEKALKKQLDSIQADFGTVVLMEVTTGEVRAIANFTRTKSGEYKEQFNYAIAAEAEPGSTFKLATYMTLLDQHKIDTNTTVDIQHGRYDMINPRNGRVFLRIKDAEDGGSVITAKRAFEESSNVGAVKLLYSHYADNPREYTDALYRYHLNERNGLQIPGEGHPFIKNPSSKGWNKLQTLAQMAYGYEVKLSPLQMLTFYNAVANNGKEIAPIFVKEIRSMGNTVERFKARVINEKICSDETLAKVKGLLEGVVTEGTGKLVIKNNLYSVAGKTGTAQIAHGSSGYGDKDEHQASFCGYFPADRPKYSMIVVISNPRIGSHLAARVAGPVFRKIADRVYAGDLELSHGTPTHFVGNTTMPKIKEGNMAAVKKVYSKLGVKPLYASTNAGIDTSDGIPYDDVKYKTGIVPAVTGMSLSDALYALGNAGYKVGAKGSGVVTTQSVTAGSVAHKGSKIFIELQ